MIFPLKKKILTPKEIQLSYLSLLQETEIEKAVELYTKKNVEVVFNEKSRSLDKKYWLKFLKVKWLNNFTRIIQFNIKDIKIKENKMFFTIFMICKKANGVFFFTEINAESIWENNLIKKTTYIQNNY